MKLVFKHNLQVSYNLFFYRIENFEFCALLLSFAPSFTSLFMTRSEKKTLSAPAVISEENVKCVVTCKIFKKNYF